MSNISVAFENKELKKFLAPFKHIINGKSSPLIPSLENIQIRVMSDRVLLIGSNLKVWVCAEPDFYEKKGEGSFLIDYKLLVKLMREIEGDLITMSFFEETSTIEIKGGSELDGSFTVESDKIDDYPRWIKETPPAESMQKVAIVDYDTLLDGFSTVAPFVSYDDLRPAMTVMSLEISDSLLFTATDGHCLANLKSNDVKLFKSDHEFRLINTGVYDVMKDFKSGNQPVSISCNSLYTSFDFEGVCIVNRDLEDRYVDWRNAMPESSEHTAKVDIQALLKRVRVSSIFANTTTNQIAFKFNHDQLRIESNDYDYNRSSVQVMTVSAPFELQIGFNSRYLSRILKSYKGVVDINMNAPNRAVTFPVKSKKGNEVTLLLMPVMLNPF